MGQGQQGQLVERLLDAYGVHMDRCETYTSDGVMGHFSTRYGRAAGRQLTAGSVYSVMGLAAILQQLCDRMQIV